MYKYIQANFLRLMRCDGIFYFFYKQNNIIKKYKEYSILYKTKLIIIGFEYKLEDQYTNQQKKKRTLRPERPLNF
jgi:hypothetical protein